MEYDNFRDYWVSRTKEQKDELARKCGLKSQSALSQIAHGHSRAGAVMIAKLERIDKRFTAEFLRPDLYHDMAS
jgi:hypothetical protein